MTREEIINELKEIESGSWSDKSSTAIAQVIDEYRKQNIGLYKAGDFLYKLGDKGICNDNQRVFIHTGQYNADGYGVLFGFDSDGEMLKSTGYGNYQYGNNVRLATDEEIKKFIKEVFNYDKPIKTY